MDVYALILILRTFGTNEKMRTEFVASYPTLAECRAVIENIVFSNASMIRGATCEKVLVIPIHYERMKRPL